MKFTTKPTSAPPRGVDAFTLAEVLAALVFMAIVIPVAMQGLHIAGRAGAVAERKREAVRVAERVLNENLAPHFFPPTEDGRDTRICPACKAGQLGIKLGQGYQHKRTLAHARMRNGK